MPEPISLEESLRRLREFLRVLEQLLEDLLRYPDLIPGRHHDAMRDAWLEVRPRINEVVVQLEKPNDRSDRALRDLGLIGSQLVFKLSIFQHALDEYTDFLLRTHTIPQQYPPTMPPIVVKEPEPEGWGKRVWRRLMKRTLKAGDVILDSLSAAFPPLHAVKEFKEAGESGLELGESIGEGIGEALKPKK